MEICNSYQHLVLDEKYTLYSLPKLGYKLKIDSKQDKKSELIKLTESEGTFIYYIIKNKGLITASELLSTPDFSHYVNQKSFSSLIHKLNKKIDLISIPIISSNKRFMINKEDLSQLRLEDRLETNKKYPNLSLNPISKYFYLENEKKGMVLSDNEFNLLEKIYSTGNLSYYDYSYYLPESSDPFNLIKVSISRLNKKSENNLGVKLININDKVMFLNKELSGENI